jgi:hypothetical protein
MRLFYGAAAVAALIGVSAGAGASPTLSGDYVESRTCNVYIGACHANGERVTTGREAMLAWHIKSGEADGQKLDGLNVVAVIAGSDNLAANDCDRNCVIYVDSNATEDQRDAVVSAITWKYGCKLGRIAAVKSAAVEFKRDGSKYTVRVPNPAFLKTASFACNHCVMTHMVWYEPFVGLKNSTIAKATVCEYKGAPELATKWLRTDENSSFVGQFAF